MAAGLGFKTFTTGEVLTAADTNGYLMQGVLVFASAAARDAAITSPQEGQFAYLKDTNVTTYYTGSAWTNLDTTGMTNPMTTTGDMVYSSSGSTPARLGIGTTGQVLTVAGGIPSWAAASAGANNAVSFVSGSQAVSGTSYVDLATSQSVTVTTGTKALVLFSAQYENGSSSLEAYMSFGVTGATTSAATDARASKLFTGAFAWVGTLSQGFIITGLTAGSNTFTTKFRMQGGGSMGFNNRYISVIDMGS